MIKNNLNNKFGNCCDCPALTTGKQWFTNYESSRLFNDNLRKTLKLENTHMYRYNFQTNGKQYIFDENKKYIDVKCKNNDKFKFNIDSSNFNFSTQLENDYPFPLIPNNYIKKSQEAKLN
jgi:hypothetical protein